MCEQRVESVMEVLHCCRTKTVATRAVDCKTTVVKAGGRAASLCIAQRVFSSATRAWENSRMVVVRVQECPAIRQGAHH